MPPRRHPFITFVLATLSNASIGQAFSSFAVFGRCGPRKNGMNLQLKPPYPWQLDPAEVLGSWLRCSRLRQVPTRASMGRGLKIGEAVNNANAGPLFSGDT